VVLILLVIIFHLFFVRDFREKTCKYFYQRMSTEKELKELFFGEKMASILGG
jgi:hypothetical protein